jgi:hypothetical protein
VDYSCSYMLCFLLVRIDWLIHASTEGSREETIAVLPTKYKHLERSPLQLNDRYSLRPTSSDILTFWEFKHIQLWINI